MKNKLKSSENKAKNVITPKLKCIDIPDIAKTEIVRLTNTLDNYLAGVVAGIGIRGKWRFDFQSMKIIVEEN